MLSVLKQVHAQWLIGLYDHLRNQPDMTKSGFEESGINETVASKIEPKNPFLDLNSNEDQ